MIWFAFRHPGKEGVVLINRAARKVRLLPVDEVSPELLEAYESGR